MPIIPGFVIVAVVPAKSSGVSLPARTLRDELLVRRRGTPRSRACRRCLMFGTSSVRVPSLFSHVDGEPEVHVLVAHDVGLPVDDLDVADVHRRHLAERLQHRVGDEVREADLAAAGAGEVVVEDLPVDLEQLGGDGAHRRRGRHRRGSPPCSRRCAPARPRRIGGSASASPSACRSRRSRSPRSPVRAPGGAGGGAVAGGGVVVAGAVSRRRRLRCVVGEELAPCLGHRRRVLDGTGGTAPRPGRSWARVPRSSPSAIGSSSGPGVAALTSSATLVSG